MPYGSLPSTVSTGPVIRRIRPTACAARRSRSCVLLDRLQADGYNTVFLQLRHSGTVIYPSDYEPLSTALRWRRLLRRLRSRALRYRGLPRTWLSLHAWLVTYPLSSSKRAPHPILTDHPGWAIPHKGSYHLDPGRPEVRSYIAHLTTDLVRRYPVDGVHFDYFRYPEGAEQFADGSTYMRYGSEDESKSAWRRNNLTQQLREVRDSLQSIGARMHW